MARQERVTLTPAARTTSGVTGSILTDLIGADDVAVGVNVSAASGTTPTLDLSVEWSADNGTTWLVAAPADVLPQFTAAGSALKTFEVKANLYRVRWVIAGTTPSFTFSLFHSSGL